MAERLLHGLIQKAKLQAEALRYVITFGADGTIYRMTPTGWRTDDSKLSDARDREDFLVAQLSQEDR